MCNITKNQASFKISDRIRQLEMNLLFVIALMLYDEEAEPYHNSQLDVDARYEEIINHETTIFISAILEWINSHL